MLAGAQRSFPLYIIQSRTCWGWGLGVLPTIKKSLLTLTQSRQSPCRHAYRPISQWVLTESTNHKPWQCFSGELNTMVCYHFFFFSFGYMSAVRYLCALPEEAVRFPDWHYRWLWVIILELGIEPGSSGRTASAFFVLFVVVVVFSRRGFLCSFGACSVACG